ncbi:MAG: hypothetical protein GY866_07370 [Proteobacteria bacterium]|nr:hypothetical protein [Pseudomonadota bacterium]
MSTDEIFEEYIAWQRQGGGLEIPDTENLRPLLKAYMTPEEADFLTGMPHRLQTLEQLADLKDMDPAELESKLKALCEKGLVVKGFKKGVRYRLADIVFTFVRSSLWAGKTDEPIKSTAPWINKYYPEVWEQFRHTQERLMRPIAINETIEGGTTVLPYEDVRKFLDDCEYFSVSECPCRTRYSLDPAYDDDCHHPNSNCLHFDDLGRYCVDAGIGREITREETEAILKEAADSGLIHGIANTKDIGKQDTI